MFCVTTCETVCNTAFSSAMKHTRTARRKSRRWGRRSCQIASSPGQRKVKRKAGSVSPAKRELDSDCCDPKCIPSTTSRRQSSSFVRPASDDGRGQARVALTSGAISLPMPPMCLSTRLTALTLSLATAVGESVDALRGGAKCAPHGPYVLSP